jgi:hypothetical protein
VALLTVIITVEVSIVCTYVQLCAEDYLWWWRSFYRGGAISFYVLLYSSEWGGVGWGGVGVGGWGVGRNGNRGP